jgi:hypothetical protein
MDESSSDLEARMRALSDESLARIVFVDFDSYREEALAIAKAEAERRGLKSMPPAPPPLLPASESPPKVPTSRLRPVWPGFVLAALLFAFEVAVVILPESAGILGPPFFAFSLLAVVYWLACIHRIHVLLEEATSGAYPIRPGKAVGSHFIPLFNLYWLFAWPVKAARLIQSRSNGVSMLGIATGVGFLGALLVGRFYDRAIGTTLLFATLAYVQVKVRKCFGSSASTAADTLDWSSRAQSSLR